MYYKMRLNKPKETNYGKIEKTNERINHYGEYNTTWSILFACQNRICRLWEHWLQNNPRSPIYVHRLEHGLRYISFNQWRRCWFGLQPIKQQLQQINFSNLIYLELKLSSQLERIFSRLILWVWCHLVSSKWYHPVCVWKKLNQWLLGVRQEPQPRWSGSHPCPDLLQTKIPQQVANNVQLYVISKGILPNSFPSCLTAARTGNTQSIQFYYKSSGSLWSVAMTPFLTANLHTRLSSNNLHLLSQ